MKKLRVVIPEEKPQLIEFIREELPGIAYVNTALRDKSLHEVFVWHLSIVIELQDPIDNGMPSIAERELVDPFGDELAKKICGDTIKPNALFLARITWNATRELIFRVYEPEVVNDYLQTLISIRNYPRELDYRMEEDFEWDKTKFYLQAME